MYLAQCTIAEAAFRPLPPTSTRAPRESRDLHVLTFHYNSSPDKLPFDLYYHCRSCAHYVHLNMYLFNNIPRQSAPLPPPSQGFLFHLFIYLFTALFRHHLPRTHPTATPIPTLVLNRVIRIICINDLAVEKFRRLNYYLHFFAMSPRHRPYRDRGRRKK